jgi:hypothetical protein
LVLSKSVFRQLQRGFIFFNSRESTYVLVKAVIRIIIIYLRYCSDNNRSFFCPELEINPWF